MPWLEPVTLRGTHARLEPLSPDHCDGLTEAVRDGELWKLWYTFVPKAEEMGKEIESRRGIERLGAKLDGILRSHQIASNGTLRDTVVYSIIASEWPTVKAHLTYQLNEKAR